MNSTDVKEIDQKYYVSVSDFAKLSGKSKQNVYQMINTSLEQYSKKIGNRMYLEITPLKELYDVDIEKLIQEVKQEYQSNNETIKQESKVVEQESQQVIQLLKDQIENLKKQVEKQDRQLEMKDGQIRSLSMALDKQMDLLDQEQQLHAMARKKIIELEDIQKKREEEEQKNTEPEESTSGSKEENVPEYPEEKPTDAPVTEEIKKQEPQKPEKKWWQFWK